MTPNLAIDITDRDKTGPGMKSAERKFGAFTKKTGSMAGESGLGKLGKQLHDLSKFRSFGTGFGGAGRGLVALGGLSRSAGEGVGSLVSGLFSLGGAAPGAFGAVAEGAGLAAGATAAAVTAVVGLGAATYLLGEKWAKVGTNLGYAAQGLGVTTSWLQSTQGASERFGVTTDQTQASLDGLNTTLYDARYGANNLALGAMTQLGVKLKTTKDGAIDTAAAFDDIVDAIARQKDPLVQKKLAGIFGLTSMLPAIRQGSAALKREGADFMSSGAALSDAQVAQADEVEQKAVRFKQHLGALEKKAGMAAMGAAGGIADTGTEVLRNPGKAAGAAGDKATRVVESLSLAGATAARDLVKGGAEAGRAIGTEFERYVGRIEHQESRGHQFDRKGRPLLSSRGAVGDMQVLPETGRRAAARAGIAWDEGRFYSDKAYNKQIGTEELWRLLEKYGGDEVLASAGYNAGEGNLQKWLKRFGDPRKGEITDEAFAKAIPFKETRDYVAQTAPASAHVRIDLHGAPPGTVVHSSGAPGVEVGMTVHRSLEGAP